MTIQPCWLDISTCIFFQDDPSYSLYPPADGWIQHTLLWPVQKLKIRWVSIQRFRKALAGNPQMISSRCGCRIDCTVDRGRISIALSVLYLCVQWYWTLSGNLRCRYLTSGRSHATSGISYSLTSLKYSPIRADSVYSCWIPWTMRHSCISDLAAMTHGLNSGTSDSNKSHPLEAGHCKIDTP